MLNKLLNRIGLFTKSQMKDFRDLKNNPLSENELSLMLVERIGDDITDFSDKDEKKLFQQLKGVDGFIEYLNTASINDKNRYFAAGSPAEQLMIRGSFARTTYLKNRIINSDKEKKDAKIENLRYG